MSPCPTTAPATAPQSSYLHAASDTCDLPMCMQARRVSWMSPCATTAPALAAQCLRLPAANLCVTTMQAIARAAAPVCFKWRGLMRVATVRRKQAELCTAAPRSPWCWQVRVVCLMFWISADWPHSRACLLQMAGVDASGNSAQEAGGALYSSTPQSLVLAGAHLKPHVSCYLFCSEML